MAASSLWRVLVEERTLIVAVVVLTVIGAVAAGLIMPPDITTAAQVLVYEDDPGITLLGLDATRQLPAHDVLMDTHVRLASSTTIAERVVGRLALADTPQALLEKLDVSPEGRGKVLRFAITSDTPEDAAALANTWAEEYVAWTAERTLSEAAVVRDALVQEIGAAEQAVIDVQGRIKTLGHTQELDSRLAAAAANYEQLLANSNRLELLTRVKTQPLRIVATAPIPEYSVAVRAVVDAAKGLLAGLLLGVMVAFLRQRMSVSNTSHA